MKYTVDNIDAKIRIDVYLSGKTDKTRSFIQKLIESGNILVNKKSVKTSYKTRAGDKISIYFPKLEKLDLEPEEMALEILYEDNDLIVLNKPRGITVHPGVGKREGTLVSGLLHYCKNLSGIGGVERPGIVHRLDKDTSGILLIAKNDNAHLNLSKQFAERSVSKTYIALVHGVPKINSGIIEKPIGRHPKDRKKMAVRQDGRYAKTSWKIIKAFKTATVGTGRPSTSLRTSGLSLLEVKIFTGRTHQIRVHMNYIGHPVLGDAVYGKKSDREKFDLKGQFLHSYKIGFTHPQTGHYLEFTTDLPKELKDILKRFE